MRYKYQYSDELERQALLEEHENMTLVEEQNITDGNFLVFLDMPPNHEVSLIQRIQVTESETVLLKAKTQANADRADFQEELIVELAMMIYS